jgi:hypothetical protein
MLVFAGSRLDYINAQRKEMKLISNEPLENAPPSLAFATVAMGAFRGLVVDILWMRAEQLKEEGQFFDAKQLAEWITTLQPRFAAVWDFHAWNMAYNISVAIPASQPDERWRWVRNGYELLRDQGIEINPKSVLLHRQLGFIFQHKIAGVSDDAHRYYKLQLAESMAPLLGPADVAWFDAIAEAPTDWAQIRSDPNYTPLIEGLIKADKSFKDNETFVNNYLALRQNPGKFASEAFEVIDAFRGKAPLERFDVFSKAYYLRKTLKLDPLLMRELNQTYGPIDFEDPNSRLPLDWRHPSVHAIYWATKGLLVAEKKPVLHPGEDEYSIDEINADRMVNHSLQDLFRFGTIHIWEATTNADAPSGSQVLQKEIYLRPDLRMFESYNESVLRIIEKYTDPNDKKMSTHQLGHRNMLINAILSFYQSGHRLQARRIFDQMKELYPEKRFNVPLGLFVKERFREELKTLDVLNATELISSTLRESYFLYALRDDDGAASRDRTAKEVYDFYIEQWPPEHRIKLPEISRLRYMALSDFLLDRRYPEHLRRSLMGRMRIERPELYKDLVEHLGQLKQKQSPQAVP